MSEFASTGVYFWPCKEKIPAILKSASRPKVRASSGTMGTTYFFSDSSLKRIAKIRTNAMVVDCGLLLAPSVIDLKLLRGGGLSKAQLFLRSGILPPRAALLSFKYIASGLLGPG